MALKGIRVGSTVHQMDYNYLANKPSVDTAPTQNSSNLIDSGAVYAALATKQNNLTFDNAPTANSNNPVKSGGVKSALDAKQNNLTFDTTPTTGSTNPVTSDGIRTALNSLSGDSAFSSTSTHPVQNKVIKAALDDITGDITDINGDIGEINTELGKVVHVDNALQGFTEQEKYNARFAIGAVGAAEIGARRFGVSGVGGSSRSLTRLYDAVGMTATPSTDVTAGSSDFDAYAPFNRKKCVGTWSVVSGESKATFTVNAYEGDADYTEDGTMGDYVAVEVDPFYYYEADGILAVSTYPFSGYKIHPVCLDYDGNIRAHTYLPAYGLAFNGSSKAVSLPGYYTRCGSYNQMRTAAKAYNNSGAAAYAMIEPTAVFHYEWMLMVIEFATQDLQSIMYGAAGMQHNEGHKVTLKPAANKIVVNTTATYVVGQSIIIGTSTWGAEDPVNYHNRITAVTRCDASGNASSSGSYTLITYDGTDRSVTANTTWVLSRPWTTGATNGAVSGVGAVKGHTGSPVSNSNGYYPMRYRWRENVYSNQFRTTLDLADVRVADGNSYHLDWYFLADPRKFTAKDYEKSDLQDTSKGWVKLGLTTPVASYADGYIKTLGNDPDYPYVQVPTLTTGGSATTYYCDYASLVNTPEVRCVRRGGHVNYGAGAGPCYFYAYYAPSFAAWLFGAALYFLQ